MINGINFTNEISINGNDIMRSLMSELSQNVSTQHTSTRENINNKIGSSSEKILRNDPNSLKNTKASLEKQATLISIGTNTLMQTQYKSVNPKLDKLVTKAEFMGDPAWNRGGPNLAWGVRENYNAIMQIIQKERPSGIKGNFILSRYLRIRPVDNFKRSNAHSNCAC